MLSSAASYRECFSARQQGVRAADLNLTGWVRNMDDGRVEAVFEGEDAAVEKMIAWCHKGPPSARVENVTTSEEHYTGGFQDFNIKQL